jgi:GTP-binding protein HflX
MAEVERVLEEIGAAQVPQVIVYNKCDLLEPSRRPRQAADWLSRPNGRLTPRVFVSARDGSGLDRLRELLSSTVVERLNAAPAASSPDEARLLPAVASDFDSFHPRHHV